MTGATALAADQVMVMARRAGAIDRLALIGAQHVDLVVVHHRLEVAIDRGQPDLGTPGLEGGVDLLR